MNFEERAREKLIDLCCQKGVIFLDFIGILSQLPGIKSMRYSQDQGDYIRDNIKYFRLFINLRHEISTTLSIDWYISLYTPYLSENVRKSLKSAWQKIPH